MPGAYVKAVFHRSTTAGLIVDGTANRGCPAPSMPVVEYSIDEGAFEHVQLTRAGEVYTLPLGKGLDQGASHRLEVYFRAADLGQNRWISPTAHLRIAGIALDAGGSLLPCPSRPQRAIGFGDSITEGVGVDGLFTSWQSLGVNNARGTWFPIVCAALNCEYGQLGSGGQGMTRPIEMPPLPATWDRYDAATSRLSGGLLLPEPDYIFCGMGTNDFGKDITADYVRWLTAMRTACPHARFFCVVPPLGFHAAEVQAAVAARNKAGDPRIYLIDTAPLKAAFRAGKGATQLAYDGVHPSMYGSAMLGALIAVEVQKILVKER
jgi:lysophospholipase L1-like esterase